eukprot:2201420-Prymnesium_polylepis.1
MSGYANHEVIEVSSATKRARSKLSREGHTWRIHRVSWEEELDAAARVDTAVHEEAAVAALRASPLVKDVSRLG